MSKEEERTLKKGRIAKDRGSPQTKAHPSTGSTAIPFLKMG